MFATLASASGGSAPSRKTYCRAMRLLTLVLVTTAVSAVMASSPDPRAKEVDWSSKDIEVITTEKDVRIVFHTGGTTGRRLIQARVHSYAGDSFTTLAYQIIQNSEESQRSLSRFDVTWHIPRDQFEKLRSERKFYILRCDEVFLTADEVKEIQRDWKTYH